MGAATIRELLNQRPFTTLEIRMSSGEQYIISHPETAMLAGPELVLYDPSKRKISIISLLHVTEIVRREPQPPIGTNGSAN